MIKVPLKICIEMDKTEIAIQNAALLQKIVGTHSIDEADVIVALGGDGFMLQTLHKYARLNKPIYGMNCGTVGFLMNTFVSDGIFERITQAQTVILHPLKMHAIDVQGNMKNGFAFNEVSLLRQTRQTAHLRIYVDGKERLENLVCDGVLLATPSGSTAYNLSAHGPIIPIGSNLLALTPISAFRPRRWRGALLPHTSSVRIEVLDMDKRPVSAVADNMEVRDVKVVEIEEDRETTVRLLFDPEHALEERFIREQFMN